MIIPLLVATKGYLSHSGTSTLSVSVDGYLIVSVPPTPPSKHKRVEQQQASDSGGGSKGDEEKDNWRKKIEIENDLIMAVIKVFLHVN